MSRGLRGWRRLFLSESVVLLLSVVWCLAVSAAIPAFASAENLANLFSSALPLLVVAVGQTIVILTGGIDLSVTAVIGLASTCGGLWMSADHCDAGTLVGVAIMLALGVAIGAVNGAAVSFLRMPPFLVTLASLMFFGGLAVWITRSTNIYHLPASFVTIGRHTTTALAVCAAVTLTAYWMLERTWLGRWLEAVGSNARAARVSGVPVAGVTVAAYVLSGVTGAIGSILYTGRLETGSPVMGQRILLDVIGAVVIGGNSLSGGRGRVVWTIYGVVFMTAIDNSLNLLGLSNFGVLMVKGSLIAGAALLDAARNRHAAA